MILVDINILLDVAQRRMPYFTTAALLMDDIIRGKRPAMVAAHGITTLHYLLARFVGREAADHHVGWVLRSFEVGMIDREGLRHAHALGWKNFEDAVTAVTAERHSCSAIVTRNPADFTYSPVRAVLPDELRIDQIHDSFEKIVHR